MSFKRKPFERIKSPLIGMRGEVRGTYATTQAVVAVPKESVVRSEPYRRLVASLPCDRCKVVGHSQAAHGDQGKGLAIKACDLTCYPACGPRQATGSWSVRLEPGCHWVIGSSGLMTQAERREYEAEAGARTRLALLVMAQDDAKVRKVLQSVGMM